MEQFTDKKREFETTIKRDYVVVKSNEIAQKSRYELSVTEQRAIAFICSMIQPVPESHVYPKPPLQLEYQFEILDYARVCGMPENGKTYEETKSLLKGLVQKVMWLELPDGTETTVNWVSKVWVNKRSGKVKIRIDEDMVSYLFNLKEKFTPYGLLNVLALRSQYSIRLYEMLKSYAYLKTKTFDLEELKKRFMVSDVKSYERYSIFKQKVLNIALREINEYTDLFVLCEAITKGKKVDKLKFIVTLKKPVDRFIAQNRAVMELDGVVRY